MKPVIFAALLSAICEVESSGRPNAINIADGGGSSLGLCQVKYETAKWMGYEGDIATLWLNPEVNRRWAGEYLRYLLRKYKTPELAVSSYNCGRPCNNKTYVRKVMAHYGAYARLAEQ